MGSLLRLMLRSGESHLPTLTPVHIVQLWVYTGPRTHLYKPAHKGKKCITKVIAGPSVVTFNSRGGSRKVRDAAGGGDKAAFIVIHC